MTTRKRIQNSIIAGFLIGFGCIVNLLCSNPILGSFLFSLGLITVILQGRYLFTGKVGFFKWKERERFFKELSIGLFFNLLSIWVFCFLFKHLSSLDIDTSAIVEAKMNESITDALLRSFGCGAMMFIAVRGFITYEKVIIVILPVMVFILCGFDHCIANYGYMAMNDTLWCWQLPVWIIGNAVGSLVISKV